MSETYFISVVVPGSKWVNSSTKKKCPAGLVVHDYSYPNLSKVQFSEPKSIVQLAQMRPEMDST